MQFGPVPIKNSEKKSRLYTNGAIVMIVFWHAGESCIAKFNVVLFLSKPSMENLKRCPIANHVSLHPRAYSHCILLYLIYLMLYFQSTPCHHSYPHYPISRPITKGKQKQKSDEPPVNPIKSLLLMVKSQ